MPLFDTIGTGVPTLFPQQAHPSPPPDDYGSSAVQTNKFYANMLLDNRTLYAFSLPYSVWWTNVPDFYGLGVCHVQASQRVFASDKPPCQYYYNPVGIMSLCLSADEFSSSAPTFSTRAWGPLSVIAQLQQSGGSGKAQFPICNGMGFVTGVYSGLKPLVGSQLGFTSVGTSTLVRRGLSKLKVTLNNGVTWLIYASSPSGQNIGFTQRDGNHIFVDSTESQLVVQVSVLYDSNVEEVIDSAAGAYAYSVSLNGGVTEDYGTAAYSFEYQMAGSSLGGGTLIYALPHHVSAFTSKMNGKVTNFLIDSLVQGKMRLCVTTYLEMYERLPRDVGFLPWSVNKTAGDNNFSIGNFSSADLDLLSTNITSEALNVDIAAQTNLSSMYFSGKAMAKYALILLVAHSILKDDSMSKSILTKLQTAFATFTSNKQNTPLFYDTAWKGLCSQAGLSDPMADFGNTYYNDHHFHYGYFVHAAAIIGKVDADLGGSWAQQAEVKDWVNTLVRDYANYGNDPAFPVSRNFDWFSGHSIAKGLFASGDGKDEESSSEDYNSIYGMKLWGNVIGDKHMESRANLILAIERRSLNSYFLYSDDNNVEPSQIIPNKVSGIKFENKIDHTTYFGTNREYIQGIHMLPLTPISSYIRGPTFVKEEWDQVISSLVESVDSGWKGVLQLNRALYDASSSYAFFSDSSFKSTWLDDGMSRTWALAFAKGLM